jgi:hypothetical protein
VVLPGRNNDPWTAPLLLPSVALEEARAQVQRVSYKGAPPTGLGLEDSQEFNAQVTAQLAEIIDRHHPAKVTFIAKSRGPCSLRPWTRRWSTATSTPSG